MAIMRVIPIYLFAIVFTVFSETVPGNVLGLFAQGYCSIAIFVASNNIYDFVQQAHKDFCARVLMVSDVMTFVILGLYIIFVDNDIS